MRTGQSNNAALVHTQMNCLATKGLQMTYKVKFQHPSTDCHKFNNFIKHSQYETTKCKVHKCH